MNRFLLSIVILLSLLSLLSVSKAQETFTFTYTGADPNLTATSATVNDNITIDFTDNSSFYAEANAELYIHLWVPGTSYGSDFNALDANRKLTKIADNHYKIELNVRDVLGIPVGTTVNNIKFLLRNQWGGGGNNQTGNMSLDLVDAQVTDPNDLVIGNVTITPKKPTRTEQVTITLDATGTALEGEDKIYLHSGVATDKPNSTEFSKTVGNWGQDDNEGLMTRQGTTNKYVITLNSIAGYYSLLNDDDAFALNFLFRNADGSQKEDKGGDNYHVVIEAGDYFLLTSPNFSPHLVEKNVGFSVEAEANKAVNWTLDELNEDGTVKIAGVNTQSNIQNYTFNHSLNDENILHKFKLTADFGGGVVKTKIFEVKTHKPLVVSDLPGG